MFRPAQDSSVWLGLKKHDGKYTYLHTYNCRVSYHKSEVYCEKYNIVGEIYQNEIDCFSLEALAGLLPEFIEKSNVSLLSEIINTFRMLLAIHPTLATFLNN